MKNNNILFLILSGGFLYFIYNKYNKEKSSLYISDVTESIVPASVEQTISNIVPLPAVSESSQISLTNDIGGQSEGTKVSNVNSDSTQDPVKAGKFFNAIGGIIGFAYDVFTSNIPDIVETVEVVGKKVFAGNGSSESEGDSDSPESEDRGGGFSQGFSEGDEDRGGSYW